MKSSILITGGAGYIGSVLTRLLLEQGHKVHAIDSLLFGGESLVPVMDHPNFRFFHADVRDQKACLEALKGMDAVVHLAAIVGDPACKKFPETATEVMDIASKRLFEDAKSAGVKHFVFASTCSNYGIMDNAESLLTEDGDLQPQSHYAKLKVGFEQWLLENAQSGPAPSLLRFATAFGHSPRVRFDLTVNHFTRDLTLGKELLVFGKNLWRPYGHVVDLSRAIQMVLEAGAEQMRGKVFNVGDSEENYTKAMIVDEISKLVPNPPVTYQENASGDPRNYRVDFSRIQRELGFKISHTVPDGIREIHALVTSGLLSDPFSDRFKNC